MNSVEKRGAGSAWRGAVALSAVAALLVLGGCDKKPGGQVVAVVGNEEITQQELRAEAMTAAPGTAQDFEAAAPALLQRVIERNLLAEYARDQGLDRGPEYVARRRQLEQTLLASLAARKLAGEPKAPSEAEVRKFMADAPTWFAGRERLTLDQLSFPTPADQSQIKALTELNSVDAIFEKLRTDGVKVSRGRTVLDTGSIDPFVGKQIVALPNGEIFDLSTNGTTFIGTIVARAPNPTPADQAVQAASDALVRGKSGKTVSDKVAELRKAAKITYAPAYQPIKK
jgi:peptidyl-prolyl cis-trans isomerase C